MTASLGVQIAPWTPARQICQAVPVLCTAFDVVWVPDQMLARNAQVLLAAIAASGQIGVASGIAVPLGRNPVDQASAMATISELLPADKAMLMGVGAGGSLVSGLFDKSGATDLLREAIILTRRLWAGDAVRIEEFPLVDAALRWRRGATVRLTYPVTRAIPILAAVGGPRTMRLVEEVADGMICTSTFPRLSYPALARADATREIRELVDRRAVAGRPLRLIYGLNCSVSEDRAAARSFARRQVALIVGNPALRATLGEAGLNLDVESIDAVRAAFARGGGVEEAAHSLSDSLLDAFIVAGTAHECASRLAEVITDARAAGFSEFYLGTPLGPDLAEAARLLAGTVVPSVWPERRVSRGRPVDGSAAHLSTSA